MTEDVLFQEEGFSPARLLTRPKLLLAIVAASIVVLAGTVIGVGMIPSVNEEVIGPRRPVVGAQGPNRDRGPDAVGAAAAATEEDKRPASLGERLKEGISKLTRAFKRGLRRVGRSPAAIFRMAGTLIDRTFDSKSLTFDNLTKPLAEILIDPLPSPLPSPSPSPSPLPSPSPSPSATPIVSPSPSPEGTQPSPSSSPAPTPIASPPTSPSPSP